MRISLIHAADAGGGAEQCVMSLHRSLRALGHESQLVVGEKRTAQAGVSEISYVRGPPGMRRLARAVESATGLQDIYNPSFRAMARGVTRDADIVHLHTLWGSAGYGDISMLPRISHAVPSLLTLHDSWFLSGHCACFLACNRWKTGCGSCPDLSLVPATRKDGTSANWKRKRSVVARSRLHVIAVSDWLKAQALQSPIFEGCTISRIYNGIDTTIFRPASGDSRADIRARLGIDSSRKVILLAGQSVEGIRSGIATPHALAALNSLAGREDICALVIGPSAERVAQSLEVDSICLPYQSSLDDMASCYQAADITLVASEFETFGRVAAESQACGTAVVSFDSGGLREVVADGLSGFVVPYPDSAGLGRCLARLVSDDELRMAFASAGRQRAEALFAESVVALEHLALYRSIIAERTLASA